MQRPVRARRACPSLPCSCKAQGPISLTGVGPAFSRLQLADGYLWPLLAQAAQSCHPHWYHQAFAHRHSCRARPPRAHARSPSTPAVHLAHMRAPQARLPACPTCTGPGAAHLGQSHAVPQAPWGRGTHVRCTHSTTAPPGTPSPCVPAPVRTRPSRFCTQRPSPCAQVSMPSCAGTRLPACVCFFNSHIGRLYSGPVSALYNWEFTQPSFRRSELGTARSPVPR